jgi:hypothetical protein
MLIEGAVKLVNVLSEDRKLGERTVPVHDIVPYCVRYLPCFFFPPGNIEVLNLTHSRNGFARLHADKKLSVFQFI